MSYTLWGRGRLLGHSTLSYAPAIPWIKAGDFEPTALGESFLPILTGVSPALDALGNMLDEKFSGRELVAEPVTPLREALRLTTEYADLLSIHDQLERLALELRDFEGAVVPTASIGVQDTEHLLALARRDGVISEEEEDEFEPWESRPSRFQIIVELEGVRERTMGAP